MYVILFDRADGPVCGRRLGAQQQPHGCPRESDDAGQIVHGRPAQRAAGQHAGDDQRDDCAQLYATDGEAQQAAALVRRRPLGHDAVDHGEHERGRQALREPHGHEGGRAERLGRPGAGRGQQRRDGRAVRQQRLVVVHAAERGRRQVSHQVADEERAEQHGPRRVRPAERRHVQRQLPIVIRRVGLRRHGHDRHGQADPDQIVAHHAQEQQQTLYVPDADRGHRSNRTNVVPVLIVVVVGCCFCCQQIFTAIMYIYNVHNQNYGAYIFNLYY